MSLNVARALGIYHVAGTKKWVGRLARIVGDSHFRTQVAYRRYVNRRKYVAPADPLQLIWVDPEQIVYHWRAFVGKRDLGRVVGGDWDKLKGLFCDLAKHRALKARVEQGVDWEETGIFDYMEQFIATRKRPIDGCRTRDDMIRRYRRIDALIESIRRTGYRPNVQTGAWQVASQLDHIFVNIGRDGEIIFNGSGHHRLSLAKILGVPTVPALVIVRHEKWQEYRDNIARGAVRPTGVGHPDLRDLRAFEAQPPPCQV
jgi:hypothetical protein